MLRTTPLLHFVTYFTFALPLLCAMLCYVLTSHPLLIVSLCTSLPARLLKPTVLRYSFASTDMLLKCNKLPNFRKIGPCRDFLNYVFNTYLDIWLKSRPVSSNNICTEIKWRLCKDPPYVWITLTSSFKRFRATSLMALYNKTDI